MLADQSLELVTLVVSEVISQMIEEYDPLGHSEHHATAGEILDRNRLEPLVVIGAEDLGSTSDVVSVDAK